MSQVLTYFTALAAQTHAGFFTLDVPLLGYTVLLDLCLTVLLFTLVPKLRLRGWDRVALGAPLVFLAWMFLTCSVLYAVGRPVFSVPSVFLIP